MQTWVHQTPTSQVVQVQETDVATIVPAYPPLNGALRTAILTAAHPAMPSTLAKPAGRGIICKRNLSRCAVGLVDASYSAPPEWFNAHFFL